MTRPHIAATAKDKAVILVDKTIQSKLALVISFFPAKFALRECLASNRRNAFVLVHQHGRSEVSRKQAMLKLEFKIQQWVI